MAIRRVKLTKYVQVKIVTSGYDDRWTSHDVSYSANVFTDSPLGFTCSFSDKRNVWSFLEECAGLDSEQAFELEQQAEVKRRISGWIDKRRWASRPLTRQEHAAITAYLKVNCNRGRYKAEFIEKQRAYLDENPLSDDLLAIVQYQLDECDRQNTWQWGHPNGRAASI